MKIAVVGIGYVGLSLAILLSQKHEVWALDIQQKKADSINHRKSPIKDPDIEKYLSTKSLNLTATTNYVKAFLGAKFIIIATPTNYDDEKKSFNTSSVDQTIERIVSMNIPNVTIIIKSTVPVGYTEYAKKKYHFNRIIFSPEFLREGKALYDNLHPSRIIVGDKTPEAHKFANLLSNGAINQKIPINFTNSMEAEAIKLFANTYLAMRIAYFNELDTYAELKNLNAKEIIDGVCADPRIGNHYNNPSFGYGGYCLPKDTKQLLANYDNIPQKIITAIIEANKSRKRHIADMVLAQKPKTVGIYRLITKSGSDNFRSSAIQDIISLIKSKNIPIIIYEPTIDNGTFNEIKVENNLTNFKKQSDIILANRISYELKDVAEKIYTRDLFARD